MNTYRFFGTLSVIGGVKLEHFGQTVELDEETAKHPRGPAVLPATHPAWDAFTAEEFLKYRHPGPRTEATQAFKDKFAAVVTARHEFVNGAQQ